MTDGTQPVDEGATTAPAEERRALMDDADIRRALTRIAHEIVERNRGTTGLCLIGIYRKGVPLSQRLAHLMSEIEGAAVAQGGLDVALYRDDYALRRTTSHPSDVQFDISGKRVILVDEVLYTGRTVRAAMDALMDLGRPASIQLAVLVDRGHRELPIRPDYVGRNLPTSRHEWIDVRLKEIEGEDRVYLVKRASMLEPGSGENGEPTHEAPTHGATTPEEMHA